jgi:heptosyltransferase-1
MDQSVGTGARILLVKTSSLGDVVHNLPVIQDIHGAMANAAIDWVVESAYESIPSLHPRVRNVIPCDLRRWRRSWFRRTTRDEWHAFLRRLRTERYDCIIDTQGLLKSAIIARAAIGRRVGLDWKSSREPLRPFYDRVVEIPWTMHAVERNRRLAAAALGYMPHGEPVYGIQARPSSEAWLPDGPYALFLHGSSDTRKLWSPACWIELGAALVTRGFTVLLPWGNDIEHEMARRIASALPSACIAPRRTVGELAAVIAGAHVAVGVDTGLTHLAAALGVPSIGIYGATDPAATGIQARGTASNVGMLGQFPSVLQVLSLIDRRLEVPSSPYEATRE